VNNYKIPPIEQLLDRENEKVSRLEELYKRLLKQPVDLMGEKTERLSGASRIEEGTDYNLLNLYLVVMRQIQLRSKFTLPGTIEPGLSTQCMTVLES
jgi:hypothetical protein